MLFQSLISLCFSKLYHFHDNRYILSCLMRSSAHLILVSIELNIIITILVSAKVLHKCQTCNFYKINFLNLIPFPKSPRETHILESLRLHFYSFRMRGMGICQIKTAMPIRNVIIWFVVECIIKMIKRIHSERHIDIFLLPNYNI